MNSNKKRWQAVVAALIVIAILVIDQWIKIEVKTTMPLHSRREVASWFYIYFIENNGMAYGMTFIPKYALSIFRMVAIVVIGWYLGRQIMKGARWVFVIILAMVLAGAAGNLIDCMFYGLIFTQSSPDYVSYMVPFGQGYSGFLTGKVVDMFYFPLIVTTYPDWVPVYGGEPFIFFQPIFNFADAAITTSVISFLLFCRKELSMMGNGGKEKTDGEENDADNVDDTESIEQK